MQKIRKILRAVSEIFKDGLTDGLTDGQGRLLRTPSGKPVVQNTSIIKFMLIVKGHNFMWLFHLKNLLKVNLQKLICDNQPQELIHFWGQNLDHGNKILGEESMSWWNSEMPDPRVQFHEWISYPFMGKCSFMGVDCVIRKNLYCIMGGRLLK